MHEVHVRGLQKEPANVGLVDSARYFNAVTRMLPRSQRITTSAFAAAFQQGRLIRHPLLHLRVFRRDGKAEISIKAKISGRAELRAAFVVPKKLGKATLRNKVRRRLREQYRLHPARSDARLKNCDLIFIATGPACEAEPEAISAAIGQLLQRAAR